MARAVQRAPSAPPVVDAPRATEELPRLAHSAKVAEKLHATVFATRLTVFARESLSPRERAPPRRARRRGGGGGGANRRGADPHRRGAHHR